MNSVRRVLIVHPYGIGDFLFVTPVLRALRLLPTVERVDLLLGSRTSEAAKLNPHADQIYVLDKGRQHHQSFRQNFKEWFDLVRILKANRYDLLIDYSMRQEYGFLGFILGIPRRAGFDFKKRGFFHTMRFALPEGFSGRHAADAYADLAEKAGVPVDHRMLEFYVSEESRANAARLIREKFSGKNFLTVAPGGGESWGKDALLKQWPVEYFAELIESLRSRIFFEAVLIVGSASEKPLGRSLEAMLKLPSYNAMGETGLLESAALMERSLLCLVNDGGLMHIAHALRVPVVTFFGPVSHDVYGPYPARETALVMVKKDLSCRPCYRRFRYHSECAGRECLNTLTPREVLQRIEETGFIKTPKADRSCLKKS